MTAATWCAIRLARSGSACPRPGPRPRAWSTRSSPRRSRSPTGKIEVIEFFSYGCPHCAEFFPLVEHVGEDPAEGRRVPPRAGRVQPSAVGQPRSAPTIALQASGDLAKLDGALFRRHPRGAPAAVRRAGARPNGSARVAAMRRSSPPPTPPSASTTRPCRPTGCPRTTRSRASRRIAVAGKYIALGRASRRSWRTPTR